MISRLNLHTSFVQYADTCILGSYAIVSNYFTGILFLEFFKDFCNHFDIRTGENDFAKYFSRHPITKSFDLTQRLAEWINLSELNKYEIAYDDSFHKEYSSLEIADLYLMKEIHDKSKQQSFESSRNSFSLSNIPEVKNEITYINDCLDREEALLMVAFKGERGGRHISVIGYDNNGFYMVETRPNKSNGAVGIPNICSLPDIGDALLSVRVKN